jgi:hypothetical protein
MSSADPNYTDAIQSGYDSKTDRVGDLTGRPPTNEAIERNKAIKMANLLEGLEYPANKQQVLDHLNKQSPSMGNRINDVLEIIRNNLDDDLKYNSAFDIEKAVGLVTNDISYNSEEKKPYARDKALNTANNNRTGEKKRAYSYTGKENIWPANERNVSPNTPEGEEV